jgi:hypothetical protein
MSRIKLHVENKIHWHEAFAHYAADVILIAILFSGD